MRENRNTRKPWQSGLDGFIFPSYCGYIKSLIHKRARDVDRGLEIEDTTLVASRACVRDEGFTRCAQCGLNLNGVSQMYDLTMRQPFS